MSLPLTAATLICRRDLETGLQCLRSLQACGRGLGKLLVFEDGSLSDEDAARLVSELRDCTVIRLCDRDAAIDAHLAVHPHARAYRREHPLAYKLFDIPLTLQAEDYLYVDTDFLFFRPFDAWSVQGAGRDQFVFTRDPRQPYSARLPDLLLRHRLALPSRVNAGFFHAPWSRYDLDRLDWFLSVPEFRLFPALVEQTAWAVLTGGRGVRLVDPRQIFCASDKMSVGPETVAVHFYFTHKTKIDAYARDLPNFEESASAVKFRLIEPPRVGLGRMVLNSVIQKLKAWTGRG
jgi:hypothetical protein